MFITSMIMGSKIRTMWMTPFYLFFGVLFVYIFQSQINLKKISKVIGKNTISAVRSGFFWGYAGLIDNIINLIKKETGKSFKVIITGGFSHLFKNSIKTKASHNQDITIKGLIKISKLIK